MAVNDAALGKIVRSQFNSDVVSGDEANVIDAHLSGQMAQNRVITRVIGIFNLDLESCIRQTFEYHSVNLNYLFDHKD
jgi:hypothetical protein